MGEFDVDLTHEFFQGFVNHALATVHIDNLRGDNSHHQCETVFKAFARALRMAVEPDPRAAGVDPFHQREPLAPRSLAPRAHGPTHRHRRLRHGQPALGAEGARARRARRPTSTITADPEAIRRADRVVFPGQGAMPDCMRSLRESGLGEAVAEAAARHGPSSACASACRCSSSAATRATRRASRVLPGAVRGFGARAARAAGLKVPHMGWNEVWQVAPHALWQGIADGSRFYFVHSYYCAPGRRRALAAGTTRYPDGFTSAIARDNIFATQFHPEKSSVAGLTLLSNFASWNP